MITTGLIPNNAATRISLVRHGSVYNPSDIFYGRLPGFSVSPRGRREAVRTAATLKKLVIAGIFTSPLLRCRQTASEILKYHPGLKLQTSTLITEVSTPFQGRLEGEVSARNGDVYTGSGATYEQPGDVLNRTRKFLFRARKRYPGKHVIAVTHGDVILFSLLWAKDFPATVQNKKKFSTLGLLAEYPATASITTLSYTTDATDERPSVAYFNPVIHPSL